MTATDYSTIAASYDDNEVRHRIPTDTLLAAALARAGRRPLQALDVACGTGNYLVVQAGAYGDAVRWTGVDASPAMLAVARRKLPGVLLEVARAEALPGASGAFDYVTTRFAFHHFDDKPLALDELRRVCRPGGTLCYVNIDPARMRDGWLFRYFPEAALEDQKRYWSPELIAYELDKRGFTTHVRVEITHGQRPLAAALVDAERRDASELQIIEGRFYEAGLARIRDALARDPDATTVDEVAIATVNATLP